MHKAPSGNESTGATSIITGIPIEVIHVIFSCLEKSSLANTLLVNKLCMTITLRIIDERNRAWYEKVEECHPFLKRLVFESYAREHPQANISDETIFHIPWETKVKEVLRFDQFAPCLAMPSVLNEAQPYKLGLDILQYAIYLNEVELIKALNFDMNLLFLSGSLHNYSVISLLDVAIEVANPAVLSCLYDIAKQRLQNQERIGTLSHWIIYTGKSLEEFKLSYNNSNIPVNQIKELVQLSIKYKRLDIFTYLVEEKNIALTTSELHESDLCDLAILNYLIQNEKRFSYSLNDGFLKKIFLYALKNNQLTICEYLIKEKNINIASFRLDISTYPKFTSDECLKTLDWIQRHNIFFAFGVGELLCCICSESKFSFKTLNTQFNLVKGFITRAIDINYMGDSVFGGQWMPLFQAIEQGNYEIAEFLIQQGADVNTAIDYLNTNSKTYRYNRTELILSRGNCNVGLIPKMTPLSLAIEKDQLRIVKSLVAKDSEFYTDAFGFTPMLTAIKTANLEIINYFIEIGKTTIKRLAMNFFPERGGEDFTSFWNIADVLENNLFEIDDKKIARLDVVFGDINDLKEIWKSNSFTDSIRFKPSNVTLPNFVINGCFLIILEFQFFLLNEEFKDISDMSLARNYVYMIVVTESLIKGILSAPDFSLKQIIETLLNSFKANDQLVFLPEWFLKRIDKFVEHSENYYQPEIHLEKTQDSASNDTNINSESDDGNLNSNTESSPQTEGNSPKI